jgi:hypothetical protein
MKNYENVCNTYCRKQPEPARTFGQILRESVILTGSKNAVGQFDEIIVRLEESGIIKDEFIKGLHSIRDEYQALLGAFELIKDKG